MLLVYLIVESSHVVYVVTWVYVFMSLAPV